MKRFLVSCFKFTLTNILVFVRIGQQKSRHLFGASPVVPRPRRNWRWAVGRCSKIPGAGSLCKASSCFGRSWGNMGNASPNQRGKKTGVLSVPYLVVHMGYPYKFMLVNIMKKWINRILGGSSHESFRWVITHPSYFCGLPPQKSHCSITRGGPQKRSVG